jgi:hypothetical protein
MYKNQLVRLKSSFIHFDSDLKHHRHDVDGGDDDEFEHPCRCQCQVNYNGSYAVSLFIPADLRNRLSVSFLLTQSV